MEVVQQSRLWRETLAESPDDQFSIQRERLRTAYILFRERAGLLAQEIARDLPEFTRHDLSHVDALWELADLVIGDAFTLTPAEAFVFGGACLIHDLGLAVAAYPNGLAEVEEDPRWKDAIALELRHRLDRTPTSLEIAAPPSDVKQTATKQVLRLLHAERAAKLALISWRATGTEYFLIQDDDLRATYGPLMGSIAASHWWSPVRVARHFTRVLGAPPWLPAEWSTDELRLACVLRVADAAHLDASRAPRFLMALRQPPADSREHWEFQARLLRPRLDSDRLVFTSSMPFSLSEAASWWVCYETIRDVDREIREVDSLLADSARPRMKARAVAGVEDPSRFAQFVPTEGWAPVDAHIHVSDVGHLVGRLGGNALYGGDLTVPLRELIQNAADAVRARRTLTSAPGGQVVVRLDLSSDAPTVEVSDTGIGMSEWVLTNALLDFGTSLWESAALPVELPGLAGRGFRPTGRFGIGFFSVFMWGGRVRVASRRLDAGPRDTRILEFSSGLAGRPLIRRAPDAEQLGEPGTSVKVWLEPQIALRLLTRDYLETEWRPEVLLAWLCPSLDVDVFLDIDGQLAKVVAADDWRSLSGNELLARIAGYDVDSKEIDNLLPYANRLRVLINSDGQPVGRAALLPSVLGWRKGQFYDSGAVTVGGLRACAGIRFAGILTAEPRRASRDEAIPIVDPEILAAWARELAQLGLSEESEIAKAHLAEAVWTCGGEPGALPIAEVTSGYISYDEIIDSDAIPEDFFVVDSYATLVERDDGAYVPISLASNIVAVSRSFLSLIRSPTGNYAPWPQLSDNGEPGLGGRRGSLFDALLQALATRWNCSMSSILESSRFYDYEDEGSDRVVVPIGVREDNGAEVRRAIDAHIVRPTDSAAEH